MFGGSDWSSALKLGLAVLIGIGVVVGVALSALIRWLLAHLRLEWIP